MGKPLNWETLKLRLNYRRTIPWYAHFYLAEITATRRTEQGLDNDDISYGDQIFKQTSATPRLLFIILLTVSPWRRGGCRGSRGGCNLFKYLL